MLYNYVWKKKNLCNKQIITELKHVSIIIDT